MAKEPFAHRGVMLDLARLTERHDYYLNLLPHLAQWGYNMLHLHFTDDQGCALRFPSHPELATPHAYTPDEMRNFCAEARKLGIEVVPEIECFGHTDFITRHKAYRHLREADQDMGRFSGLCVFEPDSQAILRDLLRDTVDIFEPRLVHAGLDEVNFGHHPTSQKLLKNKKANALFAEHIQWCHSTISSLGARMAIWGDHLLPNHDDGTIADGTPRDTVIFDWHYEPEFDVSTLDFFLDRGFEVYGAPAIQRYRNRVISNAENFDNLHWFAGQALTRRKARKSKGRLTGMVVTVWCPYRYVPGTIEYPLALAGQLLRSEALPSPTFPARFARRFWGLAAEDAETIGAAVDTLYILTPTHREYERILFGKELYRGSAVFSRYDQTFARDRIPPLRDIESTLKRAVKCASRQADRLRDLAVAAEFTRKLYAFGAAGRQGDPGWKTLHAAMQKAWKRTRYPDGDSYLRRSARIPTRNRDHDEIMRHLNRLAADL